MGAQSDYTRSDARKVDILESACDHLPKGLTKKVCDRVLEEIEYAIQDKRDFFDARSPEDLSRDLCKHCEAKDRPKPKPKPQASSLPSLKHLFLFGAAGALLLRYFLKR